MNSARLALLAEALRALQRTAVPPPPAPIRPAVLAAAKESEAYAWCIAMVARQQAETLAALAFRPGDPSLPEKIRAQALVAARFVRDLHGLPPPP